jgi:hypothetical protein
MESRTMSKANTKAKDLTSEAKAKAKDVIFVVKASIEENFGVNHNYNFLNCKYHQLHKKIKKILYR